MSQQKTVRSATNKYLQKMGFNWEKAELATALDRHGCHRCVAHCVLGDVGWIKLLTR